MAAIDEIRVTKPMIVTNDPLPSPVLGSPGFSSVVVTEVVVGVGASVVVVEVVGASVVVVEVVVGSDVVVEGGGV